MQLKVTKKSGVRLVSRACRGRVRGNGFKLKEGRFRVGIRKKCLTMIALKHWPRLPRETLDAPSPETFIAQTGWGFEQPDLVEGVPAYCRGGYAG